MTYSTAISASEEGLQWVLALALLSQMVLNDVEWDAFACHVAMNACVVCEQWEKAIDLVGAMLNAGVTPTCSWAGVPELYVHRMQAGSPVDCFKHVVLVMLLR